MTRDTCIRDGPSFFFFLREEADPSNLGSGFAVALLVAAVWIFSISFGRLYLGVHSPTDLRGGFMLGLWITVLWCYMMNAVDTAIMFGGPFLCVGVVLSFVFVLILCPQPRPVTPTFMQVGQRVRGRGKWFLNKVADA